MPWPQYHRGHWVNGPANRGLLDAETEAGRELEAKIVRIFASTSWG